MCRFAPLPVIFAEANSSAVDIDERPAKASKAHPGIFLQCKHMPELKLKQLNYRTG